MKIALICGGPSLERGISLNSARSVMDHLDGDGIDVVPIYFDVKRQAYQVSKGQLYSNTPSDFDFKLQQTAKKLSATALKKLLQQVDLAFPVMHGKFGEDGGIQRLLERYKVPYVGSDVEACKRCFDKHEANAFIAEKGFYTLPSAVLKIYHDDHEQIIKKFFKEHKLKRAIVKPATGGSSIGVFSVSNPKEALEKVEMLFSKRMDTRVVIEPFCEGIEFTVIILQNRFGMPVAVMPTEIETDYRDHQLFDYRRKYLPSNQVRYHCPPRFDNKTIERIQVQAEQLFNVLGMQDFARFDGWLMPDGNLWFSDFNPISGMEQNSFLFQQAARIGMSHRDLLKHIVKRAAERNSIELPKEWRMPFGAVVKASTTAKKGKKRVNILFGGDTSERQVSLMSGTNAWLKLRRSKDYDPHPYLLDLEGNVWELPYALTLNHTVEEILENCLTAEKDQQRLAFLEEKVRLRLAESDEAFSEPFFLPRKMSLKQFIKESPFVFIGLHGGFGENGTLQKLLKKAGIQFNGTDEVGSAICADKYKTGEVLAGLENEGILIPPKKSLKLSQFKGWRKSDYDKFWIETTKALNSKTLIVKPRDEGCSSGIVRLFNHEDFMNYVKLASKGVSFIPANTFKNQKGIVEMPLNPMQTIMLEQFVETDVVRVKNNAIKWKRKDGWVEVTVGVFEEKGKYHSLSPSLTVAEGEVLTVEEKFQGGTGVNMTPPPQSHVKPSAIQKVKRAMEIVAKKVDIQGYCRIDTFMHIDTGEVIIIEVNTTPALTPSTVLFHQGLDEKQPIYPTALLERLIRYKGY